MTIRQFETEGLAQYSYVVADGGEAVVIDAMRDVGRYVEYLRAEGLRLKAVLETHIHADFAAGTCELAAATGAEICLSAYDAGELYEYAFAHRELRDGDIVRVGGMRIVALHTPGHTPEHLAFLLYDPAQGDAPVAMFSGDFVFAGSLGRPDLLGEDAKLDLAREQYRSARERIAALPDSVVVYPGHGAGSLCGAGLGEAASTTLGYERATDRYFVLSETEFVEDLLASVPPMPKYYPRMKRLNAAGAGAVTPLPGGAWLSVAQVEEMIAAGATVLDVRSAEAFAAGHIAGAVNIPPGPSLALWAGWLLDAELEIVLAGEGDCEAARRSLVRVGLDRVAGVLDGGVEAWRAVGHPLETLTTVGVEEVAATEDVQKIDVRTVQEFAGGHVAGARNIALGDLPQRVDEVPKDEPVIAVCGSAYRAAIAASLLARAGVKDVRVMRGGMEAWMKAGLPVV